MEWIMTQKFVDILSYAAIEILNLQEKNRQRGRRVSQ